MSQTQRDSVFSKQPARTDREPVTECACRPGMSRNRLPEASLRRASAVTTCPNQFEIRAPPTGAGHRKEEHTCSAAGAATREHLHRQ